MKILAVDTATKTCSVALIDGEIPLAEITLAKNQTHSKHLMVMIESVIALSDQRISDIDCFAVTKGPGSFTGLRIGISTVKGLSLALEKSIVGVSTLDALAFQFSFSSLLICPLMDARKGEVYFSKYRSTDGQLKKECEEQVVSPEKVVSNINEPCLFIGDGASTYRDIISTELGELAEFTQPIDHIIRATSVASLGLQKLIRNEVEDVATFVPVYLRKSDAEINRAKKLKL